MLEKLVHIALQAGNAILALQRSDVAATAKADGSPLTQADLASNEVILNGLARQFAGVPVITEEGVSDAAATNVARVFLVDPLDGTKDFLSGTGEFTVNIAMLDGARPVAGVVYAPALRMIYAGAVGEGARRANVTREVLGPWEGMVAGVPSGKLRAVTSRSHPSRQTKEYLADLAVGELAAIGSSLKFCLIAAGVADIYPRMGQTMEWDTAAGDAILRAAGGTVLAMDGTPLCYNKRDAAGNHLPANPWFVAAGRFDAFDPKWRKDRTMGPVDYSPAREQ